jgi:cytohesin
VPLNVILRRLQNCFQLICQGGRNIKAAKVNSKGEYVPGRHTSYKLKASDRAKMDDWMKCIKAAMMKDPLFEIYQAKRLNASTAQ